MTSVAEQWLTLVLITWAASFLAVLAAMARSLLAHRRAARLGRRVRAGPVAEHVWLAVPATIVVLIAVLAVRWHDAAHDEQLAATPDTSVQAPADNP